VFSLRILQKDYSLARKPGWENYYKNSYLVLFKFGGSSTLSAIIYGALLTVGGIVYQSGSFEKAYYDYLLR